jgi:hypothetical protein
MRIGVGSVNSHGARLPWRSDGVTLVRNADSALLPSLAHKEPVRCYDSSTDWPCPETVDAGGWCHSRDVFGECLRRHINQLGTLREADGPPGTPVHGDGTIWPSAADHVGSCLASR